MTDMEVGKRLLSVLTAIESMRSDLKMIKSEQDEIRDSVLVLIENHKCLFEVFPYLRADLDSVVKCLTELLDLAKSYQTGVAVEMFS